MCVCVFLSFLHTHSRTFAFIFRYSFDFGKFHFIAYSSEVYFARTQDIDTQKKWLINDLARANQQRERTPWVVAFAHRPSEKHTVPSLTHSLPFVSVLFKRGW